jgi:serpin B
MRYSLLIFGLICLSTGAASAQATAPATEAAMSDAGQSIADANNHFAFDLYHRLSTTAGNLFFSPYSIDQALMMVHAGAKGATAEEIATTLHLPTEGADEAMADLSQRLDGAGKPYQLSIANAIWGQQGHELLPHFLETLSSVYHAQAMSLDYRQPAEAARTINDWVSTETQGRIADLIDAGLLGPDTKLVLTNAIYFKGNWKDPFKSAATRDRSWHGAADAATRPDKTVPMMSRQGRYDYFKDEKLAALQMPYAGDDLAMLVILPGELDGLAAVEKTLDADRLATLVAGLRPTPDVQLSLPKFKLEAKYDLNNALAAMGMPTAFSSQADFSGMDGSRDLQISDVVHKAFVKVDEEGTEAAAASGVGMRMLAMRPHPVVFDADHPFLFVIRDVKSGAVLFVGRVVEPGG